MVKEGLDKLLRQLSLLIVAFKANNERNYNAFLNAPLKYNKNHCTVGIRKPDMFGFRMVDFGRFSNGVRFSNGALA